MSTASDVEKIILRVAEIMIEELKLEDVTPATFDPEIDLIDEVGIDSMDLATVALVLVLGTVISVWFAVDAYRQRRMAAWIDRDHDRHLVAV